MTNSSRVTDSDAGGVFVSWTGADTDRNGLLGELVNALRAADVPVWIDDRQIAPFDSISESVRTGLSEAKLLLAWYSTAYPTRRACREELTLALLAAERIDDGNTRVLVINPESSIDHVVEARLLDRRFAAQEELAEPEMLAERIRSLLMRIDRPLGALPHSGRTRWYGGLGWEAGSRRFVGRLSALWQIHDRLHRTTGLTGPGNAGRAVAIVSGFGGVGKSLLAAEYAHLFADQYPGGVIWLSASGNDTEGRSASPQESQANADSQIARIAEALQIEGQFSEPDTIREAIKSELDSRDRRVLWIVDDLPTGIDAVALDAWRCPAKVVHELITTRDQAHDGIDTLDLDVLDRADAVALLTQGREFSHEEMAEAELLAGELGFHPLACDVAGLYISRSTDFAGYRRQLAGSLREFDSMAAELRAQLPGNHARQIVATLTTSLARLGTAARSLLRLAAQLAPSPIPRKFVVEVLGRLVGDQQAEATLNRALQDSHDGLWAFDSGTAQIGVHVLVSAAVLMTDDEWDLRAATLAAAVDVLVTNFLRQPSALKSPSWFVDLVPHARHVCSGGVPESDAVAGLLSLLAALDSEAGRSAIAAEEYARVLHWLTTSFKTDHPYVLTTRSNLAGALQDAGRLEEALPLYEQILADRERLLGPDDSGTLNSRSNLATALQDSGRLEEALPLYEQSLADSERLLGPDHPHTLRSRVNLGSGLHAAGRLEEALPLLEQAVCDGERLLGSDHPDTLTFRNNLAGAQHEAGRLEQALPLYEQSLADSERLLGPDHPHTLRSRNNLAGALQDAGRLQEALPLYEQTLTDGERLLGADHPDTLACRRNLATALYQAGRLAEAAVLLQTSLTNLKRLLGSDHSKTRMCRAELALVLVTDGRLDDAMALVREETAQDGEVLPEH